MVERILQLLNVTCSHKRMSQPFMSASVAAAAGSSWEAVSVPASHYVVCLECGKKFTYDWQKMRVVR
jgi:hypothetical protein